MRNEGGGFAANIYGAMPEGLRWQVSSYRQPSPRGEGAPQGRIGYSRHERQMRKAEKCAAHVGKRESQASNGKDFSLTLEMTIRESFLVPSHKSLVTSHS